MIRKLPESQRERRDRENKKSTRRARPDSNRKSNLRSHLVLYPIYIHENNQIDRILSMTEAQ